MSHDEVTMVMIPFWKAPLFPVQQSINDPSCLCRPSAQSCPPLRTEWRRWMVERGYPAYRARQVLDWVIHQRAESFDAMSDLPKSLRQAAR